MQIKRYRGADMQEALQKVKQDLGTDAIILSTRQVRGGAGTFGLFGKPMLEVTAARDLEEGAENGKSGSLISRVFSRGQAAGTAVQTDGTAAATGAHQTAEALDTESLSHMMARTRAETESLLTPLQDDIQDLKSVLETVGASQRHHMKDENALQQIRTDLGEMRQLLHLVTAQSAGLKEADYADNLVVLFQQLLFNGVEEKFARRMIEESQKNIPQAELEDFSYAKIFLARMLMKIVKVTGGIEAKPNGQRVMALVGPTGVGKTTTVAKLASEQLLKYRRQVALITVDTFRIAAVEQLKTYAKIMGVPISVVNGKDELHKALQNFNQYDVVFIDTGGRSQRDEMQMSELHTLFRDEDDIDVCLTLSAATKDADLTEITRRFGEIPLASVIFTKLDESTAFGSLFNHAIRFKLPIAYLTTGQKVPEDIEVATRERLVDLLLNISSSN